MKSTKNNVAPVRESEDLDRVLRLVMEGQEEIIERLDAAEWGLEIPAHVAREIHDLRDLLEWRCLSALEQRLTRLEATLDRIERKLP